MNLKRLGSLSYSEDDNRRTFLFNIIYNADSNTNNEFYNKRNIKMTEGKDCASCTQQCNMINYDRRQITEKANELDRQTETPVKLTTNKKLKLYRSLFRLFLVIVVFVVILLLLTK